MKSILHPTFKYTPSFATDIRKTFAMAKDKVAANDSKPLPPAHTGRAVKFPKLKAVSNA